MENRTSRGRGTEAVCEWCDATYVRTGNRQRYCSARCRDRSKYASRKARGAINYTPVPKSTHACRECGSHFEGRAGLKYCSDRCRERFSYEQRKRSDAYQRDLERQRRHAAQRRREAGVAEKVRYDHCQWNEGPEPCPQPVYARALCRRHYDRVTYRPRSKAMEATCLAYRFGTESPRVKPFPFKVLPGDRLIAFCSWCGMGTVAESKTERVCPYCHTRATINLEEALALWVTSRTRSTGPSRLRNWPISTRPAPPRAA